MNKNYSIIMIFMTILNVCAQNELNKNLLWLKESAIYLDKHLSEFPDSLFLNDHLPIDLGVQKIRIEKDRLGQESSLFYVFKSDIEHRKPRKLENIFSELHYKNNVYKVGDSYVHGDKLLRIKEGHKPTGILLSYNAFFTDKKRKLPTNYVFIKQKEGVPLYEAMVYPYRLSEKDRQKVQTYLSLKYGISLQKELDYLDSKGDIVWAYEQNHAFSKRVAGLGRDDYFGLNQIQTQNSTDSFIKIGLTKESKNKSDSSFRLQDMSYFVWGDNGAELSFEQPDHKPFWALNRKWKFTKNERFITDSLTVSINLSEFKKGKSDRDEDYYLYLSETQEPPLNLESKKVYKGVLKDSITVVFAPIQLSSQIKKKQGYISIYKQQRFDVDYQIHNLCDENTKLKLNIEGGFPPYNIAITKDGEVLVRKRTDLLKAELSGFSISDRVTLTVKDASGRNWNTVIQQNEEDLPVYIEHRWQLGESGKVKIEPLFVGADPKEFVLEWFFQEQSFGHSQEFTVSKPGNYQLKINYKEQCKTLPFEVFGLESEDKEKMENGIYPNPVQSGVPFTIYTNLDRKTNAVLKIYTLSGQFITSKEFKNIDYLTYESVLRTPGTYLVIIKTTYNSLVQKLVVK